MADIAVILAAPRSGSTYLQNLLALHPRVVSPQETHLFHNYLAPLLAQWDRERGRVEHVVTQLEAGKTPDHRLIGLPTLLEDDEFMTWARAAVHLITDRAVALKPAADLVIEKTPSNSLVAKQISRLSPSARFVHIVRDPHHVVASQLGAREWGGRWADVDAHDAALRWVEHVRNALELSTTDAPVMTIRYEDLVASPEATVHSVFGFLGRPLDASQCHELVAGAGSGETSYALSASVAGRIGAGPVREPQGFARAPGERRRALSPSEHYVVSAVTARLATELGYESGTPVVGARAVIYRLDQAVRAARRSALQRLRRLRRLR